MDASLAGERAGAKALRQDLPQCWKKGCRRARWRGRWGRGECHTAPPASGPCLHTWVRAPLLRKPCSLAGCESSRHEDGRAHPKDDKGGPSSYCSPDTKCILWCFSLHSVPTLGLGWGMESGTDVCVALLPSCRLSQGCLVVLTVDEGPFSR